MHPIYDLKAVHLEEPHASWIGREVIDRYGRRLGHVKQVMVEERTLDEALSEDHDPHGWAGKADFVAVTVETGLLGWLRRGPTVMLPIAELHEHHGVLEVDENAAEIRSALR